MSKHPFGIGTISLCLALLSALVACKKEPSDLPPRTAFDDKGMPQGDSSFTPAEIHRDQPIGLDTAGLSAKPAPPATVASKPTAPESKPVAAPAVVAPPAAKPAAAPAKVVPPTAATPAAKAPVVEKAPKPAEPVIAKPVAGAGEVVPSATGDWVIQVNVHRSQAEAEAQVAKLAKDGIPAYTVAFQAGEEHLSGSYWRVRVGRFASRAEAQKYGSSVLEPKGLKFWIDRKSNESKQGT
jgi:cell division protein FtsN